MTRLVGRLCAPRAHTLHCIAPHGEQRVAAATAIARCSAGMKSAFHTAMLDKNSVFLDDVRHLPE